MDAQVGSGKGLEAISIVGLRASRRVYSYGTEFCGIGNTRGRDGRRATPRYPNHRRIPCGIVGAPLVSAQCEVSGNIRATTRVAPTGWGLARDGPAPFIDPSSLLSL